MNRHHLFSSTAFALAILLAASAVSVPAARAALWVTDGPVYALAVDRENGLLYVAGDFHNVGPADDFAASSQVRNYLAAFDLAGGAAIEWNPNPDNVVRALALSPDGATLYAGGDFDVAGGQVRHRIAALRTDTGLPTNQWPGGADGVVNALLLSDSGDSIFVGGTFTTIVCGARGGFAELTLGETSDCGGVGHLTPLGQNAAITGGAAAVYALAQADTQLYVGGSFSHVGSQPRANLAAFDTGNFNLLNWAPAVNDGVVQALHVIPGRTPVYAGGTFTSVAGVPRAGLAALDPGDAHPLDWDPAIRLAGAVTGVSVNSIISSLDRSVLYVGGDFDSVSGDPRGRMAAILASTGELIDDWQFNADDTVRALLRSDADKDDPHVIYAGGDFTSIDSSPAQYLAALDALPPEEDPPVTTATPAGGLLNSTTLAPIVLSCTDDDGSGCAATYYTTDGNDPTTDSTRYTQPISVTTSGTVKFFSVDNLGNAEAIKSEHYDVETTPPATTASPSTRVFFTRALEVTLSCTDTTPGCAATYYTTDGSRPTTQSTRYTGPITLTDTTVLQFFSVDAAGNVEGMQRQEYVQNRGNVGAISLPDVAVAAGVLAARMLRRRRRRD